MLTPRGADEGVPAWWSPMTRRVQSTILTFLRLEAASGIVLLVSGIAALVWANAHWDSYYDFWHVHFQIGFTLADWTLAVDEHLEAWVDDALMALFFFVVGMEIKREVVVGELHDPRRAALPILAAVGGMVVPALVFFLLNRGGEGADGWGIPVATDIAFVVGVLALFGRRLPAGLRVFLLTLAIADDVGGIAVIAIFYTSDLSLPWLLAAIGLVGVVVAAQRFGVSLISVYLVIGLALWFATFESGIHATVAGVALGFLTPARPFRGKDVMHALEHNLLPYTSFVVVPIFALANAGVRITPDGLLDSFGERVALGIILGLVAGKLVGISLATFIGVRLGVGRLPDGVNAGHVLGASLLAGIGFTVSLFIAELSFRDADAVLAQARLGVLIASLLAGVLGMAFLYVVSRVTPTSAEHGDIERAVGPRSPHAMPPRDP